MTIEDIRLIRLVWTKADGPLTVMDPSLEEYEFLGGYKAVFTLAFELSKQGYTVKAFDLKGNELDLSSYYTILESIDR